MQTGLTEAGWAGSEMWNHSPACRSVCPESEQRGKGSFSKVCLLPVAFARQQTYHLLKRLICDWKSLASVFGADGCCGGELPKMGGGGERIGFSEPADQHLVPLARAGRRREDKHNVYILPAPFPPHLSSLHKFQTVGE